MAKRPLSPHLQVYKLPYNALMSISGRAVGIGLALFIVAFLGWGALAFNNPDLYNETMILLDHDLTKYGAYLLLFVTLFYLGNGVRHVLWNMGIGLNEKAGIISGNIVLLLAFIVTLGVWQLTCGCWSKGINDNKPVIEGGTNE